MHRESIPFHFMSWLAVFFIAIAALFLGLFLYHVTIAPIDNDPDIMWVFPMETLVMGAVAALILQFRTYELVMTPEGIIIKFGRIKKFIRWMEIDAYSVISTGTILNSGGMKINLGPRGWYYLYTVIGKPRVALQLNSGKIKEVIFSTGNPVEVARIIQKQTGKTENAGIGRGLEWM